jgi:DNA-binding transcriptional MerR regulator
MRTFNRPRTARRGQVLIILLGVLFLGGSAALSGGIFVTGLSTKQIDKALDREVSDSDRRSAAGRVVESWEKDAERFLEGMEERRADLVEQLARHGTDRTRVESLLDRQDAAVDDMTRRVIDYRFELRDHLTAVEWRALFVPADEAAGERK